MAEEFYVVPQETHRQLVEQAYLSRGYSHEEAQYATKMCAEATRHGNRTHNALKGLHLDHELGSGIGNWVPNAEIEVRKSRFKATESWNANRKIGQAVAYKAFDRCIEMAEEFGVGVVSVDNATHYLWGGGYAIDVARRGYIAYTNCTSALAEVAPFGGKFPTLGTNPHTWGFPTMDAIGFPIVLDWATSEVAMGRVQQLKREGAQLPPGCAVDADGNPTLDPNDVDPARGMGALLSFGRHKGYGLGLLNELFGAVGGGSLPTARGKENSDPEEKTTTSFYFQVIHPDAISSENFAKGRSLAENLTAVIQDILGHGNQNCMLPGEPEYRGLQRSEKAGGLLFSAAEIAEFQTISKEIGESGDDWDVSKFKTYED